jgi:hypothetical protein
VQAVGEVGHPESPLGRLGQPDQDLVVVEPQAELAQVVVELRHQPCRAEQVGPPRHLLLGVQPAGPSGRRHGTSLAGI